MTPDKLDLMYLCHLNLYTLALMEDICSKTKRADLNEVRQSLSTASRLDSISKRLIVAIDLADSDGKRKIIHHVRENLLVLVEEVEIELREVNAISVTRRGSPVLFKYDCEVQ